MSPLQQGYVDGKWVFPNGAEMTPPPAPGTSAFLPNGVPTSRQDIYVGGTGTNWPGSYGDTDRGPAIAVADAKLAGQVSGARYGMHRMYLGSADSPATARVMLQEAHTAEKIPYISMKVPGDDWAACARGDHDQYFIDRGNVFAESGLPVWVAIHHEPEDDCERSSNPAQALANWRNMQDRCLPLLKNPSPTTILTSIITQGWYQRSVAGYGYANMWPANGNNTVDMWGSDVYVQYGSNKWPNASVSDIAPYYIPNYLAWKTNPANGIKPGLLYCWPETGLHDIPSQQPQNYFNPTINKTVWKDGPGSEWFRRTIAYLKAQNAATGPNGLNAVGVLYFDIQLGTGPTDNMWVLDGGYTPTRTFDVATAAKAAVQFPF